MSMVCEDFVTIVIELRFSSRLIIGFNGFQWLETIGRTMEWFHTIVQVILP